MTLSPEMAARVAEAPVSGHLSTSVDDRPHVAPVWYGYRDGTLYFLTGGRKLANLRRNPRAAVSIEDARGGDVAWNVTLLGRARVVTDAERMAWAEGWIYDRYEDDEATDEGRPDGGTPDAGSGDDADDGDDEYALIEFDVGSASWYVYD